MNDKDHIPRIAGIWETYEEYISSWQWKEKSQNFINDHPFCTSCGRRRITVCEVCNYSFKAVLQVHHKSYERVGNEDGDDLEVVCQPCHMKKHGDVVPTETWKCDCGNLQIVKWVKKVNE